MKPRSYITLNALGVICAPSFTGYNGPIAQPMCWDCCNYHLFFAAIRRLFWEQSRLKYGFKDIETAYLENWNVITPVPLKRCTVPKRQLLLNETSQKQIIIVFVFNYYSGFIGVRCGLLVIKFTQRPSINRHNK